MKRHNYSIFAQGALICLSLLFLTAAKPVKVVVSEANPNSAEQGTTVPIQIKGSGFAEGATVAFWRTGTTNPGGVTVLAVTVHDSQNITADIDVALAADIDNYDIEVRLSSRRKGKGTELFSVKLKGGGQNDDTTRPALIGDFRAELPTSEMVRLFWTATGDDGDVGTADHYVLLKYEQSDLTACEGPGPYGISNPVVIDAPWPREAGGLHEVWAEGLTAETCYAFSIEPFDEVGNTPGPSFTVSVTQAAPIAGTWRQEVLPAYAYSKILAFDPASMQPVVYGNDSSTVFFERSSNGSWTVQTVKKNGSGGISLGYNPVALTFGGGLQSHRNVPSYAERQPDGSWDVTQITRENVRWNSLAFDDNGVATVAFRTTGDRILRLARYNGSSFDIETPLIPGNQGEGWGGSLRFHPVSLQPTIVYLSEDKQEIRIATFDGGAWSIESIILGLNFGSDIDIQGFAYDPNNQPVIMFRQALYEKYEYFLRVIRKDSSGNWGPTSSIPGVPDGMTVYPGGLTNQNGQLAIANDGTLFLAMSNTGNQIRVGRFCEEGRTPALLCETSAPTRDAGGANVWYWELVHESGDASLSIAIEENSNTIAIIAGDYYECDPEGGSVICGNPPTP